MPTRVAVSVESMDGLQSIIDPRFGRAFAYIVVEIDTNTVAAQLDNTTRQAAHGAGTGAAAMMASNNVNAVISGRFGPKALQALDNLGIEMWTAPESITVKEAIAQFVSGVLGRATIPSGSGNRGMGEGRGMGQGGGSRGGGGGMGRNRGGGGKGRGRGMGQGRGGGMGK